MKVALLVGFAVSLFLSSTQGFGIHSPSHHGCCLTTTTTTTTRRKLSAVADEGNASGSDKPQEDLFIMEGWEAIQKDLNQVPIFAVATPEGNPLAYQVNINNDEFVVPF